MKERAGTVHVFADYESCVQALTDTSGNILLTTGSKELAVFAPLEGAFVCACASRIGEYRSL